MDCVVTLICGHYNTLTSIGLSVSCPWRHNPPPRRTAGCPQQLLLSLDWKRSGEDLSGWSEWILANRSLMYLSLTLCDKLTFVLQMWLLIQPNYSLFSIFSMELLAVLMCCLRSTSGFTVLPDHQSDVSTICQRVPAIELFIVLWYQHAAPYKLLDEWARCKTSPLWKLCSSWSWFLQSLLRVKFAFITINLRDILIVFSWITLF